MKVGWRFGRAPSREPPVASEDWKRARPASIARSLARALALPSGGWFVLDASRRIGRRPRAYQVAGVHWVAWRDPAGVFFAPEECPHMGASLDGAERCRDSLICPWHGLELGPSGHASWRPRRAHDDGVLVWIRPESGPDDSDGRDGSERPRLAKRPERHLTGVISLEAACDPRDVIANRLDPWHGSHFHPYAFGALEVLSDDEDGLRLVVEKRILGSIRVVVEARFHCPNPRSIVMTILRGEGEGSVVETHACPISPGRCRIVEATLATSPRPGFRSIVGWSQPLLRPVIERAARRLWVDDAAYAERIHALRERGWSPRGARHAAREAPRSEV